MTDPSPAPRRGVLAAGNFIVDCVKLIDQWPAQDSLAVILSEEHHNGGGPYNVLKNLAKLGADYPLAAIGCLGDDAHGSHIRADCERHRIDARGLLLTAEAATSYTDVMTVNGSGRRTFFHQPGANALLEPAHFDFRESRHRLFYLGYLLLLARLDSPGPSGRPAAAEVLARARAAGLVTALDCVSENSDRFHRVVAAVLPEVDLLFANDFEAEKLTGLALGRGALLDRTAFVAAASRLLGMGVRSCVVIHAPEGVCAVTAAGEEHWQPAVRMPPDLLAGAAGAGDALAAGVIYGWHEEWSLSRSLELGVCAAAASLRHTSCSETVGPAAACLEMGRSLGYVASTD